MDRWVGGWIDAWKDGWLDGWGWMDGYLIITAMDEWMDGCMHGRTHDGQTAYGATNNTQAVKRTTTVRIGGKLNILT